MPEENILQIRPVSRDMVKFMIGLSSVSGDGKTRSALEMAHGLTDYNPEKIGLLDCENRRGSLYSDIFGKRKFLIADLMPPFSPERYIKAMREFAETDIECLIIDSYTHVWEGEGGCEEIANSLKPNGETRKRADWLTAKRKHKRFMNTALFLPFHVFLCIRAREKTAGYGEGEKVHSLGIQPVCEKNVMFEMTMSFMLENRGTKRRILKLNGEHEPLVGTDGYITAEHGKNLRDWIGGFDPMEKKQSTLRLAATQGTEALRTAWEILPAKDKKLLQGFKDTLKDTAKSADEEWLEEQKRIGSGAAQEEEAS